MGLFGGPSKCDNCSKPLGDKKVFRSGKNFCCENCMKTYGKEHPSKKKNVCEFC